MPSPGGLTSGMGGASSHRPPRGLPHGVPGAELREAGRRLRRGLPPGRRAVGARCQADGMTHEPGRMGWYGTTPAGRTVSTFTPKCSRYGSGTVTCHALWSIL